MLPKLELEVIAEASREVSVGDLEDEESSHLVDEAAAAKLAKSLPASADIAILSWRRSPRRRCGIRPCSRLRKTP